MKDIRRKVAEHYVQLAEQPGWAAHARHMVVKMDEEMPLFKGLRELCNQIRSERRLCLASTQASTPDSQSTVTGS